MHDGGSIKASIVRKKDEGVSPVIATILMVAITVVLAATLYLMVPNLQEGATTTPPIRLIAHKTGDHNWSMDVVSNGINPVVLKYALVSKNGTVVASAVDFPTNSGSNDTYGITWVDANEDHKVSTNDYILINNPNMNSGDEFRITSGAIAIVELPY